MNFSIILPTYNREKFISKAIESVLKQSHQEWELIIIDDGSTDNTNEIIKKYTSKDDRVRYIFQENNERCAARNNGIINSKFEWICFIDSDDVYHETHLLEFKNLINKNKNLDGLYFSGVSFGSYDNKLEKYDTTHKSAFEFILLNTIGVPRSCCSKKILVSYKFNEQINLGEDTELWARITQKYPVFYHQKKTFIEIEHDDRSINKISKFQQINLIKLLSEQYQIRKSIKKKLFSNAYFSFAKQMIKENKKLNAVLHLIISITYMIKNKQNKHKILIIMSLFKLYPKKILKQYI